MLATRFRIQAVPLLLTAAALGGCAGAGAIAPEAVGIGAGAGAGVVSANPLVGVAVAIGARFATAEAIGYVNAEQRRRVQRAIAMAGGDAPDEAPVPWKTAPDWLFDTLYGTVSGHVEVVRDYGSRIRCREVLYTVVDDEGGVKGTVDEAEADIYNGGTASPAGSAPPARSAPPAASPPDKAADSTTTTPLAADRTTGYDLDWPEAITEPVLAAVVCFGPLGWQWAVSDPRAQHGW